MQGTPVHFEPRYSVIAGKDNAPGLYATPGELKFAVT